MFIIGGGDIPDGLGMTSTVLSPHREDPNDDNSCMDFNTGTRITLDYNKIQPQKYGIDAVVWVLSHETVHAAAVNWEIHAGLSLIESTKYEETIACQFQEAVRRKIGFNPGPGWHLWGYISPNPVENVYNLTKIAMRIDLSLAPDQISSKMNYEYYGTGLKDATPYAFLKAIPPTEYFGVMHSLIFYFLK